MQMYLLHDHPEDVWTILRSMHFSDELKLVGPQFVSEPNARYELSDAAKAFLTTVRLSLRVDA